MILNCSVEEEYRIVWNIDLRTGSLFRSDFDLGITPVLTLNETSSMLIINATESNNGTICTCTAILKMNEETRFTSCEAVVILYGPPSSPTNLTAV